MKSKRTDGMLVIIDDRIRVEHNVFEDGSVLSITHLTERQALALGRQLLKHVPDMRKKYKGRKALSYFIHLTPEVSFFITGRSK